MSKQFVTRIGLGVLSLILLWVTIGSTASAVLAKRSPAAAATLWPWSATALSERAAEYANQADLGRERFELARDLARQALQQSLLSPVAARVLGQASAEEGNHPDAARWFAFEDALSRRDLPVRLWLVQDSVAGNDLPGAVRHIDIALRTSNTGARLLIPMLVNLAAYPEVARPLAQRLSARPIWWGQFISALTAQSPANRSLHVLVAALHLDMNDERERLVASEALSRLVASHRFADASTLYRSLVPGGPGETLRNGDFRSDFFLPPFDWSMVAAGRVQRNRRPDDVNNFALYAFPGDALTLAQQVQMLPPGRYRLSFVAGVDGGHDREREADAPTLATVCIGTGERDIATIPLPRERVPGGARGTLDFVVPAEDCPGQWIRLVQQQSSSQSGAATWIDDVRLDRIGG